MFDDCDIAQFKIQIIIKPETLLKKNPKQYHTYCITYNFKLAS